MSARRNTVLLVAALLLAGGGREAPAKEPPAPPESVVFVLLGGGVRTSDLLDDELMPTVAALAAEGRVVDGIASGAADGYGAAGRILTGRDDGLEGATLRAPPAPTLCEYVRQARGLEPEKVWYVTSEGGDHLRLATSTHERYGPDVGPSIAHGMGAFGEPLKGFLDKLGRPVPMEPEAWGQLRRLRVLSRNLMSVWLPQDVDAGLPRAEVVERALLREIDRKSLLAEGPNPRDERALRAARSVLEVHRPLLTVIRLVDAEQADVSYERYRAVLKANDAGIEQLRATVASLPRMAGKTTFVIVADRGRDEKPGPGGKLGANDDSRQRGTVALVAHGPGILRRGRLPKARRLEDVCPTVARLLRVEAPESTGAAWEGLVGP